MECMPSRILAGRALCLAAKQLVMARVSGYQGQAEISLRAFCMQGQVRG